MSMQNILNRLAKANKAQTKLNKSKNSSNIRKVKLGLAQDLDASVSDIKKALSNLSVDFGEEVDNVNQAVANLNGAVSQYKRLNDALQKFLQVSDEYMNAASELGIDVDPDADHADLLNEVADKFDSATESLSDLDEIAGVAARIVQEMPMPYL